MEARELADHLARLFPALDALDQRLSLAIYRDLARGAPVALADLLPRLGIGPEEAARRMRDWPGVYYDGEQRIIGYWGLALARMQHRLRIQGRELFAWCAWDTLFLPALLGGRAEVSSACHDTGAAVRLTVGRDAVESADPPELSVSFVLPQEEAVRADVITSFCHYVHFFSSPSAAAPWLAQHPGAFLVPLAEAFEVGQILNRRRYEAVLDAAGALT